MDLQSKMKMEREARVAREREKWWAAQSTKAKKAIVKKALRDKTKRLARQTLRTVEAQVSGYVCPGCFVVHPTPEARKACKESHFADD